MTEDGIRMEVFNQKVLCCPPHPCDVSHAVIRIKPEGDPWTKWIFVQLQVPLLHAEDCNYVLIVMGYESSAVLPFHKEKQTTRVLKSYPILYLVFEPDKGVARPMAILGMTSRNQSLSC
jgi:hypothetical protein